MSSSLVTEGTDLILFKSLLLNSETAINLRGVMHFTKTTTRRENVLLCRDDNLIREVCEHYVTPSFFKSARTLVKEIGRENSLDTLNSLSHVPVSSLTPDILWTREVHRS